MTGAEVVPDYGARSRLLVAVRSSDLTADERHVLRAYADYVNKPYGLGLVFLPRQRLKAETGLNSRRAQRAVDGLEDKGWFVVVEPGAGTRATRYRIVPGGASDPNGETASGPNGEIASSDPNGETAGGASDPKTGRSDPNGETRTRNVGNPPTPLRRDEVAEVLVADGAGDIPVDDVIAAAAADPETMNPAARLLGVPGYRRQCVERVRLKRDRATERRWAESEKCDDCGKPVHICSRMNARLRPADRCPRAVTEGAA